MLSRAITYINIFLVFSYALYYSSVRIGQNVENDIFSLVSSNLLSTFSPNIGHHEKNNIQILNYNYSAKHF